MRSRNPIDQETDDAAQADAPDDDEEGEGVGGADDDEEGEDDEEGDGDEGDDDEDPNLDPLTGSGALIGDPFYLSSDVEVVSASAIVKHADGRQFRINLLTDRLKVSPHTKQRYTHVLIVCPEDDDQMVPEVVRNVIEANGHSVGELVGNMANDVQDAGEDRGRARRGRRGGDIPEG